MQAFLKGTARHSSSDHVCGRLKDKTRPVPSVGAQTPMELEELDPGRERLLRLPYTFRFYETHKKMVQTELSHLDRKPTKVHANCPLFSTDNLPKHLPLDYPQN